MYIQLTIKNLESIMRTQTIHFLSSLLCMFLLFTLSSCNDETDAVPTWEVFDGHIEQTYWEGTIYAKYHGTEKNRFWNRH